MEDSAHKRPLVEQQSAKHSLNVREIQWLRVDKKHKHNKSNLKNTKKDHCGLALLTYLHVCWRSCDCCKPR